jgi:sugar-specific transcriptional regulator TrmB
MDELSSKDESVELLQQLGLKEYESKCFVALARRDDGTAKQISETSNVPRTRVYDAIRVLESKGLVETQHSNPQRFRAVPVDEAVEILRTEYETRTESLRDALRDLDPADTGDEVEVTHEVWALSGEPGITSRTQQLIDEADSEIVMVIGEESVFTPELEDHLQAAHDRGVNVVLGTISPTLRDSIQERLPGSQVFVSGLEWLRGTEEAADETEISRLLLTDRESILVSTYVEGGRDDSQHEQAVFGRGFDNGLVAIVRRLMATGHLFSTEPASGAQ